MRTLVLRIALILSVAAVVAAMPSAAGSQASAVCFDLAATVVGTPGDDVVAGSDARDVIASLEGNDTIEALGGNDLVCAGEGNDTVRGGAGHDDIEASGGDDLLDGGAGGDFVNFHFAPAAIDASLATGIATGWGSDTMVAIEHLTGSNGFADRLAGTDLTNFLDGRGGDDVLMGAGGRDLLDGDMGNDTMDGGSGQDLASYFFSPRGVRVNLGTRTATGWGTDRLLGLEAIDGSGYADRLIGNRASNVIWGERGNDYIVGGPGPDALFGNAGRDRLDGGRGRDFGNGGTGIDLCVSIERKRRCP
jgi:Ca2+-binding RTX toxin-like protein